ncbi:hypothetical protein C7G41_36545 [Bradyrhizobium sp. MOS002]|nr:hypothetical protein C7G41_36545 [Bradyrhizobium sp. MOS002]
MRRLSACCAGGALFLLLYLACGSVHPERRVALLIDNSASKSVPPLANPVNDAEACYIGRRFLSFRTSASNLLARRCRQRPLRPVAVAPHGASRL